VSATGQSAAPPATSERKYRVRSNGEPYREIARHTLNNPERWNDIFSLNPNYDPRFPVPGGTVIRLPADAQVEPSDIPHE
jgi:hypothetical protein